MARRRPTLTSPGTNLRPPAPAGPTIARVGGRRRTASRPRPSILPGPGMPSRCRAGRPRPSIRPRPPIHLRPGARSGPAARRRIVRRGGRDRRVGRDDANPTLGPAAGARPAVRPGRDAGYRSRELIRRRPRCGRVESHRVAHRAVPPTAARGPEPPETGGRTAISSASPTWVASSAGSPFTHTRHCPSTATKYSPWRALASAKTAPTVPALMVSTEVAAASRAAAKRRRVAIGPVRGAAPFSQHLEEEG